MHIAEESDFGREVYPWSDTLSYIDPVNSRQPHTRWFQEFEPFTVLKCKIGQKLNLFPYPGKAQPLKAACDVFLLISLSSRSWSSLKLFPQKNLMIIITAMMIRHHCCCSHRPLQMLLAAMLSVWGFGRVPLNKWWTRQTPTARRLKYSVISD